MLNEKIIARGEFEFGVIAEGNRKIDFGDKPLKIEWTAYKNEHPLGPTTTVYVDYDNGMTDEFKPYSSIHSGWGYGGVTKDTPLEDIIKSFVKYDLFHAFFHISDDPNYSHLHWALYGNYKDRVDATEDESEYYREIGFDDCKKQVLNYLEKNKPCVTLTVDGMIKDIKGIKYEY
jgi:hypothetical protein